MISILWRTLVLVVFGFLMVNNSYALIDPIEYANYLQNFQSQINTMYTASRELMALENQAKNLGKLSDYQWQDVEQIMNQMGTIMQQGQSLSTQMSDVDAQFRQRYPDYTLTAVGQTDYQNAYKTWNDTTLDTLRTSLSAVSLDAGHIQSEHDALMRLQAQGNNAIGRMQALQVTSEIAGENVNQLMQLRELVRTQMSAQNTYMAYQVSKDTYTEESLETLVAHTDTQFPRYQNNPSFGTIQTQQGAQ